MMHDCFKIIRFLIAVKQSYKLFYTRMYSMFAIRLDSIKIQKRWLVSTYQSETSQVMTDLTLITFS